MSAISRMRPWETQASSDRIPESRVYQKKIVGAERTSRSHSPRRPPPARGSLPAAVPRGALPPFAATAPAPPAETRPLAPGSFRRGSFRRGSFRPGSFRPGAFAHGSFAPERFPAWSSRCFLRGPFADGGVGPPAAGPLTAAVTSTALPSLVARPAANLGLPRDVVRVGGCGLQARSKVVSKSRYGRGYAKWTTP